MRAAGVFRWTGTGSGSPTTSGNWVDVSGTPWGSGHYPGWDGALNGNVDGDRIFLDQSPINALAGGDLSAKGLIQLLSITNAYIQSSGTTPPDVASSGIPLLLNMQNTDAASVMIDGVGAGNIYLKGAGSNGLARVLTISTNTKMSPVGTLSLDGTIQSFIGQAGNVLLPATAHIYGNFSPGYTSREIGDLIVTITAGAQIDGLVEVNAGTINNNIALSAVRILGGVWNNLAGNITTVYVNGGKFVWTAGTLGTAEVTRGGTLDGSASDTPRTITTASAMFGGYINFNTNSKSITVSDGVWTYEGNIDFPSGTKLTVAA